MNIKKYKDIIIKVIIQILSFIWFSESFAISLFAVKSIVKALCQGQFGDATRPAVILAGTVIATIIFGRYYCGYICSFGAMQDLLFWIRTRLYKKNIIIPKKIGKLLSLLKYVVLLVIIGTIVFDFSIDSSISPWTAFGKIVSLDFEAKDILSIGGLILLLIAIATLFFKRAFCSFLCPMGAVYSLISKLSYDKRSKKCSNGGDCCICQYRCKQHKINYVGVAFTVVVFVLVNVWLVDLVTNSSYNVADNSTTEDGLTSENVPEKILGPYTDGTYTGRARGFRGNVAVTVTVEDGYITGIDVSSRDDAAYMNSAKSRIIPEILKSQNFDVDVVSGATFSSRGLIQAVENALEVNNSGEKTSDEKTSDERASDDNSSVVYEENEVLNKAEADLSNLVDGVYEGTGTGFRGELKVSVKVTDGKIEDIKIVSYYDDEPYLFHAAPGVLEEIIDEQSLEVDAVSGATYSSNGLIQAVANALGVDEDELQLTEPRGGHGKKDKGGHHVVQKFIESDEQYEKLVEQYKEMMYGPDGKKVRP